jgi:hypothetical protein
MQQSPTCPAQKRLQCLRNELRTVIRAQNKRRPAGRGEHVRSCSIRRSVVIERSTMFSNDSRVCSSSIDAILIDSPSMVEASWKSKTAGTGGEGQRAYFFGARCRVGLLTSGRLLGYLARRPGNRASTARCPKGRAGTQRVQAVDARGRRRQNGQNDQTAVQCRRCGLCEHITELSVHIPCGCLRGRVLGRWQSCPDEDSPEEWEDCDVSSARDLFIVCLGVTADGVSRWTWLGCDDCRAINAALERHGAFGRWRWAGTAR